MAAFTNNLLFILFEDAAHRVVSIHTYEGIYGRTLCTQKMSDHSLKCGRCYRNQSVLTALAGF